MIIESGETNPCADGWAAALQQAQPARGPLAAPAATPACTAYGMSQQDCKAALMQPPVAGQGEVARPSSASTAALLAADKSQGQRPWGGPGLMLATPPPPAGLAGAITTTGAPCAPGSACATTAYAPCAGPGRNAGGSAGAALRGTGSWGCVLPPGKATPSLATHAGPSSPGRHPSSASGVGLGSESRSQTPVAAPREDGVVVDTGVEEERPLLVCSSAGALLGCNPAFTALTG